MFSRFLLVLSITAIDPPAVFSVPLSPCPKLFKPSHCQHGDVDAVASNACYAQLLIQDKLNAARQAFDPTLMNCREIKEVELSHPGWGSIKLTEECASRPTETTCKITVGTSTWVETAYECDSPIPGLLEQLRRSRMQPKAYEARCVRFQPNREEHFAVPLNLD